MPLGTMHERPAWLVFAVRMSRGTNVRKILSSALLATLIIAACPAAMAGDDAKAAPAQDSANADGFHLPPFPADAHTSQSAVVDGRTLKYTVTVGSLPVRDEKGDVTSLTTQQGPGKPGDRR